MTVKNKSIHSANKKYYETRALLTLKALFPDEFSEWFNSDRPDLVSNNKIKGIEVVRAVDRSREEASSYYAKFMGGKFENSIPEEKLNKFIALGNHYVTLNEIDPNMPPKIVGYSSGIRWHTTNNIFQAISKKVDYLDDTKWCTQYVSLYIFTDSFKEYDENDIKEIVNKIQQLQNNKKMKYEFLFVDDCGWFHKCNLKTGKYEFYNTESKLHCICKEALRLCL